MPSTRTAIARAGLLAAVLAAPAAQASTTLGGTGSPEMCTGDVTRVQATSTPPHYSAPTAGVLTSWRTQALPGAGQTMRLKVLRPGGGPSQFVVIGQTPAEPLAANVVNNFPIRIPVRAGDRLGNYHAAADGG